MTVLARWRHLAFAMAVMLLSATLAGGIVYGQASDSAPDEVTANENGWPLAHQNYHNHRNAIESSIDSSNVGELGVAWTIEIPGRASFGAAASAPLVANGVVYLQDLASNVFAIDLETGEQLWEKRYDEPVTGPNGPGIGYGKLYIASGVNSFAALDLATGEEVWSVETPDDRPTGAIQPYVFDNKVFITTQAGVAGPEGTGVRGYEGGRSGHIYALDPETGETIWEFQTVQDDFWGNPELNSGGGIWYSPVVDAERGITIWGVGNPAPFPGTVDYPNASSREEPNLYANSVIALDNQSGELVWYNYLNPDDLFDLDVQLSPMLVSVDSADGERELIIASGKLGDIVALDPDTGETVWRTPVGKHQNDEVTEIPEGMVITVYPGVLGGVETPMAFADGMVYAPVLNLPTEYTATGFDAETGTEALTNASEHTNIGSGTSEVVALDAATGIISWTRQFDAENYGGTTVVNDLLFTATSDGVIHALDRFTGEVLWTYTAPAGIIAWPAVAGDTILWPAGLGENASLIALRVGEEMPADDQDDGAIYKQSPWWPYLSAHIDVENPPTILGGPIEFRLIQEDGAANLILPSPRELDPTIFGTEGNPMATEVPAIVFGAPMGVREVQEDGTFITNQPTPFGDNFASTRGSINVRMVDMTATDGATTQDEVEMVAEFNAPNNAGTWRVEVNTAAPHGWFIPTAGGVATNVILHGASRWGTQLMPTEYTYAAFWGMGSIYFNDELMAENRLVHGMFTEYVRGTPPYGLVFDEGVNPNSRHFHVIVPPFTPQGQPSPVPTGFTLPNGMDLPFIHVMFPEITVEMEGSQAADTTADSATATASPTPTASATAVAQPEPDRTIEVTARAYEFSPSNLQVKVGETIRFVVESQDMYHTFSVKRNEEAEQDLFSTRVYPGEEPAEIIYTFDEPGSYYLYCKPHEGLDMVGTIEVVE